MKFKRVIMIAAMFFAVVPMVVYAIFSNNTLTASGEKEFSTIVTSVAENQASPLNALVSSAKADIDFVASVDAVKSAASSGTSIDAANAVLTNFANENALVTGARIVDNSGKIIAGTDYGKSWENFYGSSLKDN